MSKFFIKEEGQHKYYAQIPNIVDSADLSPHAIRLYLHLKRVAGDAGECYQSVRTMAKLCKMSKSAVHDAKISLVEAKFIKIENKKGGCKYGYQSITILDIWEENNAAFSSSKLSARKDTNCPPGGH
jgi:hypothetical protein